VHDLSWPVKEGDAVGGRSIGVTLYVFTNDDSCSSILNKELVAKEHSTIYS
jgi:hypothetical protein